MNNIKKRKCKELKRLSRENLIGKYKTAIGAVLLVLLITLLADIPFTYLLGNIYASKTQTVLYYVAEVLISIIAGVLHIGIIKLHLLISDGKNVHVSDLFYGFRNHSNRFFAGYIIYYIFDLITKVPYMIACLFFGFMSDYLATTIVLCAISCVLHFIVFVSFAFYFFILITEEDTKITACIAKSINLSWRNVFRLLYVYLSFIPVALLGILSLGIGFLWIEPYFQQTLTGLYQDIENKTPHKSFDYRV